MDCAEEADEGDCCRDGDVRLVDGGHHFKEELSTAEEILGAQYVMIFGVM